MWKIRRFDPVRSVRFLSYILLTMFLNKHKVFSVFP